MSESEVIHNAELWVIERIKVQFADLAEYRRVPPPAFVAGALLFEIQDRCCFMCWALGRNYPVSHAGELIEDHDHSTGMVRSLLCRSCNALEGKSHTEIWKAYRAYAPANGWYYSYMGRGEQWKAGFPEPLPNRIGVKDLDIRFPITRAEVLSAVEVYKTKLPSLPTTERTDQCERRFDSCGVPILLAGEEYTGEVINLNTLPIVRIHPNENA